MTWLTRRRYKSEAQPPEGDDERAGLYRDRPIWDGGPTAPANTAPHPRYSAPPGPSGPWYTHTHGTPQDGASHSGSPRDRGTPPAGAERAAATALRPRRLRLAEVLTLPQMRAWQRGAIFAIAAGVVFTILLSWRVGVTAAVLAVIATGIYEFRRPPSPAAQSRGTRLTGAQRRTQRQLARLKRAGFLALHSRPIPDSDEFIDHLVVGPTGIYAIDSEEWNKNLPVRMKKARQLWHGPFSMKERLEHAMWEAQQASKLLTAELGTEIPVRPAMAIYGPAIPWDVLAIRDVDVFSGGRLGKYLRENAWARRTPRLSRDEIERVHNTADRVLPLSAPQSALQ